MGGGADFVSCADRAVVASDASINAITVMFQHPTTGVYFQEPVENMYLVKVYKWKPLYSGTNIALCLLHIKLPLFFFLRNVHLSASSSSRERLVSIDRAERQFSGDIGSSTADDLRRSPSAPGIVEEAYVGGGGGGGGDGAGTLAHQRAMSMGMAGEAGRPMPRRTRARSKVGSVCVSTPLWVCLVRVRLF